MSQYSQNRIAHISLVLRDTKQLRYGNRDVIAGCEQTLSNFECGAICKLNGKNCKESIARLNSILKHITKHLLFSTRIRAKFSPTSPCYYALCPTKGPRFVNEMNLYCFF